MRFGLVGALLALSVTAAQAQTIRVRGAVEAFNGDVLTVKSREGEMLTIKMAEDTRITAVVKASLGDIKPNSFVGATAMPEENGRWRAIEVHIFPESMRGTGEGDRAYDYKPKSTMTNGTVNAAGKTSLGGAIEKTDGTTLTLKYKEGEKQIDVSPQTVIVAFDLGAKDELKPGAQIYVPGATRQSDGTLMANRINVGRGIAPPM